MCGERERDNLVFNANFSIRFEELVHLVGVVRNDIVRSIWILYMISMSVRVEQCFL